MSRNVSQLDLEQHISSTRDPRERAIRAVAAHREARETTLRLAAARRDAILDLYATGCTWQEVADLVGMSLKTTIKAARGASSSPQWWKRIPTEVADQVKLGPGGRPQSDVIPKAELMKFIERAMADREHETRRQGRGAARVTPGELAGLAEKALGKPVAMPSLRSALYALIEHGKVARVGHGRYVLVSSPIDAAHHGRRPRSSRPRPTTSI